MDINEARVQWEKAAPGWAKWEDVISLGAAQVTNMMLDMAEVESGHKVLDLASGAGSQTLITAERIGPTGKIVANDISQTMLDHVEKNARGKGFSNVSTLLGAVQELNIEPSSFDAVICRFALMLFANPGVALSNVLKVLKPGGKMSVIVFSSPAENQFFVSPMQILLRHAGKTPPVGAPGLFSLGEAEKLEKLFTENGFSNVEISKQNVLFKLPPAKESLTMIQEAFGAYRAVISGSPPDVQNAAWDEVLQYLKTLEAGSGMEAPSGVLVASAQKP